MMGELERYKLHLVNLERSQRTIDGYIGDLVFFMNWLECDLGGSLLIGHITPDDLNRFLLLLKTERDYKPASRRRVAEALKGFFAWAYSQGYIASDMAQSIPKIKVPESERSFLKPEEVNEWINEVDHSVSKVAMELMYYAGLRISEATNLKMDDLSLEESGGWLKIRNAKGGRYRRVPIAPVLATKLHIYLGWRVDSDYLLATEKTGRIRPVTIQAKLREARNRLGWPKGLTAHTLRHSFASHIYSKTQDILVVSKLLGHTNLATTQIYAHLHDERMAEAVQVL